MCRILPARDGLYSPLNQDDVDIDPTKDIGRGRGIVEDADPYGRAAWGPQMGYLDF